MKLLFGVHDRKVGTYTSYCMFNLDLLQVKNSFEGARPFCPMPFWGKRGNEKNNKMFLFMRIRLL